MRYPPEEFHPRTANSLPPRDIQGARGIGACFFNQKTNKIANKLQELQQWDFAESFSMVLAKYSADEITHGSKSLHQPWPEPVARPTDVVPGEVDEDLRDGDDQGQLSVVRGLVAISLIDAKHKKIQQAKIRWARRSDLLLTEVLPAPVMGNAEDLGRC
jgi:hypothetical protein